MFKGFQEGISLIKYDLETILSNGLDSDCHYNLKLALSDVHNLMTNYKNEKKSIPSSMLKTNYDKFYIIVVYILVFMILENSEHGEFSRRFPDAIASYSTHVDVKKVRLLLKKIEYFLSWADESKLC